jgi:hypothetical protein
LGADPVVGHYRHLSLSFSGAGVAAARAWALRR